MSNKTAGISFKRGIVEVPLDAFEEKRGDPSSFKAQLAGNWAVYKNVHKDWVLYHVPSDTPIGYFKTGKKAKGILETLDETLPGFLRASKSDVMRDRVLITSITTGKLPFNYLLEESGLKNLGERSGKRGDHWGYKGGSKMIRVGSRDIILSGWVITGVNQVRGRNAISGAWGMVDGEDQKRVTKDQLDKWIEAVKKAPTMVKLRDLYRSEEKENRYVSDRYSSSQRIAARLNALADKL